MPRKSTVLTALVVPPKPKPEKPEKVAPEQPWRPTPGAEWRVRPTGYGPPRLWPRPAAHFSDDFDAEMEADAWRSEGVPCVVEEQTRAGYVGRSRPAVTVEMLALEGLARPADGPAEETAGEGGSTSGTGRWRIMPEGYRRITEAMGISPVSR